MFWVYLGLDVRENKTLSDMELMEMPLVKADTSLYDALNLFKTGRSMYRASREQRVNGKS